MTTTSRFDQAAAEWDKSEARVGLAREVGAAMARAVPMGRGWKALDYGAGTGLLTLNLLEHVGAVVALDASTGMLEQLRAKIARANIQNVVVRQCNLESETFPENDFELVASSMTLHHVRDAAGMLRKFAGLLKPGGWVAVADLEPEDGSFHGPVEDVFHQGFDRETMEGWMHAAGLNEVKVTHVHDIEKQAPTTGELRKYGVFVAVGRKVMPL